jgi:hypothetical protein
VKGRAELLNEIRYAERISERTARLYRNVQATATWLAIVSGSGAAVALAQQLPAWVTWVGGTLAVAFTAAIIVVSPSNKAAANEADRKRFSKLRADSHKLTDKKLAEELDRAREGTCQEVEALRDVTWNDVMIEIGRPEARVTLTLFQRILAKLA